LRVSGIHGKCPLTWDDGGCETIQNPKSEGTLLMRSSHSLDAVGVTFDDGHLVANAGLIHTATLAEHLGLKGLFEEYVDLGSAAGPPTWAKRR